MNEIAQHEALQAQPDHDRLLADLLPVGAVLSCERTISNSNALFADIFGYSPGDLLGKSWEMLFPSHRDFLELGDRWHEFMSRDGQHCDERLMLRKNDEPIRVRVKGRCKDRRRPYMLMACTLEIVSPVTAGPIALSGRERAIVEGMNAGLSSKEIGRKLGLSHRTVESYRARLMAKAGARNAYQLLSLLR